jgi:hypothetical protein
MIRRYFALGTAAAAVAGGLALASLPAQATTLTCTHSAGATTAPVGCGGLQSASTTHGTLDLAVLGTGTASGNYFNSPVGVLTDSQGSTREDFTVFAEGGMITGGPGNLGRYVAMYTPDGRISSWTHVSGPVGVGQPAPGESFTAGPSDLCLSVVSVNDGPSHAARWHTVLRNCNTNGTFTIGTDTTTAPTENAVSFGRANQWQVWAPVTGANGLLLVNSTLSHGFRSGNVQYVLDIRGGGGSGTGTLAFPENDALNQEWSIIGCTHPADQLGTGYQFCP